ncbi:MAG: acetylxylan esterase, partial [Planctomycetota bacterium]
MNTQRGPHVSRFLVAFVFASFSLGHAVAQAEKTGARTSRKLDLSKGWRFQRGDDSSWSSPTLDDAAWKPIAVGRAWEKAGHSGYDGYAWYRLKFRLPASWKRDPQLARNGKLLVQLGYIDDVDQTWLNGELIGSTGSFPDDYQPAYRERRRYLVSADKIRWEGDNVLAVRVYDGSRDGGLYSGSYSIGICSWSDLTSVSIGAGRGDGIFPHGAPMNLSATLRNDSKRKLTGEVRWEISTDAKVSVTQGKESFVAPPGTSPLAFRFDAPSPGFYRVSCRFVHDGREVSDTMILGYAPEKVRAPLTARSDLRSFWDEALAELKSVPPQFRVTEQPAEEGSKRKVFEVEMRSLGNVRVRGWLEVPTEPGRYPAILRVPGYGSTMRPLRLFD